MVTLKIISALTLSIIFSGCGIKYYDDYEEYNYISVKNWVKIPMPKKAYIAMYAKNTNFKILEKQDDQFTAELDTIYNKIDNYLSIYFKGFKTFPIDKDYILILDNKIRYKISDIHCHTLIRGRGSLSKDRIHNTIDTLKINGRYYRMGNFMVPKEAGEIIK